MADSYMFELPKHHKSIIKVIGVGGGGSNAVNHMYNQGIKDVEFVVCNTDAQALKSSPVPNRLQLGVGLTEGLGAGANPDIGKNAAIESKEEIRTMLSDDTKMVFITAGMGGGTGTGAAPVIAKIARDMDLLTVGIVTAPFSFEGKKKMEAANKGIAELKENCDTVLVILNDKLREVHGNLPISKAFGEADNVLTTAAKGIAEIITVPGYVNVDFMDVQTVMKGAGAAVMGSATADGEGRALRAAEMAISSPLLNSKDIHGATKILLSIISGEEAELQMDELTEITEYIQEKAGDDAEVIFGHGIDPNHGQNISVTVIATGFEAPELKTQMSESRKKVIDLESNREIDLRDEDSLSPKHSQTSLFDRSAEAPKAEPQPEATGKSQDDDDDEDANPSGYSFLARLARKYEIEEYPSAPYEEENEARNRSLDNDFYEERNKNFLEMKRAKLMEQARLREERLRGSSNHGMNNDDFKERLEIPAYQRRQVRLSENSPSSERNISRYNLNDDDEIMGDNKFLHDNVD
ncbi:MULTISPECIES: cell division protein FtsZ [Roseivirga]|uniref:cell division protein FtsZ n=1 Tax=Roseivirga TaxID=290180 RepID=UPI00257BDFE3|nr:MULTISPECIES: cell division protein FtsZ [Roseivirga]MEC7753628.1 cell division protein FtsZ [Bacteroidota bacterium]